MATVIISPAVPVVQSPFPSHWNLADLQKHLGGIPIERIRLFPAPGTATMEDLERVQAESDRLMELIDGVLVEKTMGYYESRLAAVLIHLLSNFLDKHDLGFVLGPDATLQILPKQVREPDVSFVSWTRYPNRKLPRAAMPAMVPDLAIEVLSVSNTVAEMDRKLREYFRAGTRLVWYIDPDAMTITVYHSVDDARLKTLEDEIDGGEILPGLNLSVREIFSRAGERE